MGSGSPRVVAENARVALVHDFLLDVRGAERVFEELCAMWPAADIFTAVYDEDGTEGRFAHRTVRTSFLQRLRPTARSFRALLPLYPAAIESLDLSGYDLVLSSSSAWAHAVLCDPPTLHVSYCHNPFRYAWNARELTLHRRDPISRGMLREGMRHWRQWDWIAAQRTDRYIANSATTQARVASYFGREAAVVHPPVQIDRFTPGRVGDHYVIVSELMAHKQIELAVQAFTDLRRPLVVIGDGPDGRRLRHLAGPTVQFAGRLPDGEVAALLQSARALVVTSVEEFGIVAVEAMAAGRPVIARRGGGALETVRDGVTGCFWSGAAAQLADAVVGFDDAAVDPADCVAQAARFAPEVFRRGIEAELARALDAEARADEPLRRPLASTRLVRRASRDSHR
jgi:glycosyltransferase involved in cell wall biosynthesis